MKEIEKKEDQNNALSKIDLTGNSLTMAMHSGLGIASPFTREIFLKEQLPIVGMRYQGGSLDLLREIQPGSTAHTICFLSPPFLQSSKLQDLPIPPPKLVDLWRIEGEDLDLHFHRTVSPLSELNPFDLVLEVPFVVFFFVLPLFSPHKHLLLLVGFGSEGLEHFLCSCLCFCA